MEEGLTGGGEMQARIRAFDWTRTPLGAPDSWPQSLKTAVSICLDSRFPMSIRWGEQLITLYNDAYIPLIGRKHPGALGVPGLSPSMWGEPEIRAVIEPMLRGVLTRGEATWSEDQRLILERNGFAEEVFLTYAYSPLRVESGAVGGVFTVVSETTQKVLGERRLHVLRALSARMSEALTAPATYAAALSVLGTTPHDVPFCLLYTLDEAGTTATLAGLCGTLPAEAAPRRISVHTPEAPWPLSRAWTTPVEVEPARLGAWGRALPGGPWPEPVRSALVMPLPQTGSRTPAGFFIAGTSPRRPLDEAYRDFFSQLAQHIADALTRVRAYEEERRRAEVLAELDRAKTAFFSNVSHEFRTPLTLVLGPVEELLSGVAGPLTPAQSAQLDTLGRNTRRLLKLVNSLLDYSRLEAGRVQATFVPTDLSALTRGLASAFGSLLDQAGLSLRLDCPPLPEPLYVDRDLWEKIVLNLVSNAFKFTFEGGITVRLEPGRGEVTLAVEDTGTGIPPEALPRIFERFYRVEGARGRTHEGSGIGLALVQEMVKLHGGTLGVKSTPGRGTRFTVSLPMGSAHLPAERLSRAPDVDAEDGAEEGVEFVEESSRWLPGPAPGPQEFPRGQSHILLVDDTQDMRAYVSRLLREAGHTVEEATDGLQALAAVRARRPDLVLTDAMMPGLDGFGLLRELRAAEHTRLLPVILLSARAGEESRVEGLSQGADEYLVKPFSARELLARVRTQLELSRLRATLASERFRSFVLNVPGAVYECAPEPPWRFSFMSEQVLGLTGYPASDFLAGRTWSPHIHPEDYAGVEKRIAEAVERQEPFALEYRVLHKDGGERWISELGRATYHADGRAHLLEGLLFDITARKATEQALQRYQRQLTRTLAENATSALYMTDAQGRCTYMNPAAERMTGHVLAHVEGRRLHELVHPPGARACTGTCALARLLSGTEARGGTHEDEFTRVEGGTLPVAVAASPILDEGRRVGTVLEARDLTETRRTEAALSEAHRRKDEFLAMLAHELRNPMAPLRAALKLLEARTALDDKGRHAIGIIERQTTHLARLVDDLLDVSRITRGRIELRKSVVELPALVESALQSAQPLIDSRHHEVSVTLPRKPLRTFGDAVRLEQIIVNLLTNAAKYTEPGGLLRVGLERAGAEAEIRVKDTGIGMPRELLNRVFNLFEQADRPLDRSQGGLGIGLTLVKNLVELHGGTIEARSEGLGHGSEFIVRLPLAEESAAPRPLPEPREDLRLPDARRILVVDDNLDAADTLAELLQTWEHTVWQAHDGLAALQAVDEHRPDIVLLDIGLPGMDGYEVARRLRAGPLGAGLTLVALTGYGQASDRSRALEAGFDQHFVKPVDIDGLQKFIERRPPRG